MNVRDLALLGIDDDDDMDDIMGEDDEDLLGAPIRLRARFRRRKRTRRKQIRQSLRQPYPGATGAGGPKQYPLGFPALQFVNAGATTLQAQSNPQRPFRGQRLIIDVVRSAGAAGILVTLDSFNVGQNPCLLNANPVSADAFRPDAVSTLLAMPPAEPGINLTAQYTVSVGPGVGETVDVATTVIGLTIA